MAANIMFVSGLSSVQAYPSNFLSYSEWLGFVQEAIDVERDYGTPEAFITAVFNADLNSPYPLELWSFRPMAESAEAIFADDNPSWDIYTLAEAIQAFGTEICVLDLSPAGIERLQMLEEIAQRALAMKEDHFKAAYVDHYLRDCINLRSRGLRLVLPKVLKQNTCAGHICNDSLDNRDSCMSYLCDPEHPDELFGGLIKREGNTAWFSFLLGSKSSLYDVVLPYAREREVELDDVFNWLYKHVKSAATCEALLVQYMIAAARTLPMKSYRWFTGFNPRFGEVRARLDDWIQGAESSMSVNEHLNVYLEIINCGMSMSSGSMDKKLAGVILWHALTSEFLGYVDFTNNDRSNRKLCALRTVSSSVLELNGITEVGHDYSMKRSPYECGSLFWPMQTSFDASYYITTQLIPHHRVLSVYLIGATSSFIEKKNLQDDSIFVINENELIFISDSELPFDLLDVSRDTIRDQKLKIPFMKSLYDKLDQSGVSHFCSSS